MKPDLRTLGVIQHLRYRCPQEGKQARHQTGGKQRPTPLGFLFAPSLVHPFPDCDNLIIRYPRHSAVQVHTMAMLWYLLTSRGSGLEIPLQNLRLSRLKSPLPNLLKTLPKANSLFPLQLPEQSVTSYRLFP